MTKQVIGIGAGGHAKVIIDVLRNQTEFHIVGFTDTNADLKSINGIPIIGNDSKLEEIYRNGTCEAFIGIGSTGNMTKRKQLYIMAQDIGFELIAVIHQSSQISTSNIGIGATIFPGTIINTGTTIGNNVIVNTGAIVEHDCDIGSHVHIATGAILTGGVSVADEAFIGAGATIKQCVSIGERAIVGAGAVVINDVEAGAVVTGVPARKLEDK